MSDLGPESGDRLCWGFYDSRQLLSLPVEIFDSTFDSKLLSYHKICPSPPVLLLPQFLRRCGIVNVGDWRVKKQILEVPRDLTFRGRL